MPENQVKKHALTPEMEAAKWKPGESGNPHGRPPKGQALADVMREYLDGEIEGQSGVKRKEAFVKAVYMRAMKGGDAAMKLIMNYIDGMPKQDIKLTTQEIDQSQFIIPAEPESDD